MHSMPSNNHEYGCPGGATPLKNGRRLAKRRRGSRTAGFLSMVGSGIPAHMLYSRVITWAGGVVCGSSSLVKDEFADDDTTDMVRCTSETRGRSQQVPKASGRTRMSQKIMYQRLNISRSSRRAQ